jgi:acyl-coenzyme A synthetase/AMP-(fatty) acid ligase
VPVKQAMIDWLGPIIHEYYGATEGLGLAMCDSTQWLSHKGTVGKAVFGDLHVLDEGMNEVPVGTIGKLWFKTASPFSYFNDPKKTAEANSPDGTMSTVGDLGDRARSRPRKAHRRTQRVEKLAGHARAEKPAGGLPSRQGRRLLPRRRIFRPLVG